MILRKNSYLWVEISRTMEEKQAIRKQMRSQNRALAAAERARASARLWQQVESTEAFRQARTVALFCSLPDEPDTQPALERWHAEKYLVIPRVEGEDMRFYAYLPETLQRGAFGILEPALGTPVDPSQIDLILVPGVAFSRDGDRMGRGRGFYDRYLPLLRSDAMKMGVCYAHQLLLTIPVEPHDIRMHRVLWG